MPSPSGKKEKKHKKDKKDKKEGKGQSDKLRLEDDEDHDDKRKVKNTQDDQKDIAEEMKPKRDKKGKKEKKGQMDDDKGPDDERSDKKTQDEQEDYADESKFAGEHVDRGRHKKKTSDRVPETKAGARSDASISSRVCECGAELLAESLFCHKCGARWVREEDRKSIDQRTELEGKLNMPREPKERAAHEPKDREEILPLGAGKHSGGIESAHLLDKCKGLGESKGPSSRQRTLRFMLCFSPPALAVEWAEGAAAQARRHLEHISLDPRDLADRKSIPSVAGRLVCEHAFLAQRHRKQLEALIHRLAAGMLPAYRVLAEGGGQVFKDPSQMGPVLTSVPAGALLLARECARQKDGWWVRLAEGGWFRTSELNVGTDAPAAQRCEPGSREARDWLRAARRTASAGQPGFGDAVLRNAELLAAQVSTRSAKRAPDKDSPGPAVVSGFLGDSEVRDL